MNRSERRRLKREEEKADLNKKLDMLFIIILQFKLHSLFVKKIGFPSKVKLFPLT